MLRPHFSTVVLLSLAVSCAVAGRSDAGDRAEARSERSLAPLVGAVPTEPPGPSFSFLVGGHLYGDPGVMAAVPAPTFLAMLLPIRGGSDRFLVSLGDFVRAFEPEMLVPTLEVFTWLDRPVFNAPGNHDYRPGPYEERFGASFGALRCGNALLFVLNTELSPWSLRGPQLTALREAVETVGTDPSIDHLILCGHKVLFAAEEPRYRVLFEHCNGRDGWDGASNVQTEVVPMLAELAQRKNVVWFAGDVGVSWTLSLFYDRHPETGITCVATGLGSTRRDHLLRVAVGPGAEFQIEPVPLVAGAGIEQGQPVTGPLENYGVEAWRRHFADAAAGR